MNNKNNLENDFDISFSMTDLMTSLMIIFILMLVLTLNKISHGSEQRRDTMVKQLQQKISTEARGKTAGFDVKRDENDPLTLIVNMDEKNGLKFESNKSEILEVSKADLRKNYGLLVDYVCSPDIKDDIDSIQIIGHTDSNPVKADPKFGNLSLSQDRALSVLKFGLYQVGVDTEKGKCLQELASINGRGMAEPKKTLEESRRVEFKIRVKSYEQKRNLQNLFGKIDS